MPIATAIAMHQKHGKLMPSAVHCASLLSGKLCADTGVLLFDCDCLHAGMPGSMVPPEQKWSVLPPTASTATCGKRRSTEC